MNPSSTPLAGRSDGPSDRRPLAGRTALVTGGGRGIGRAIALVLAADGCAVAINYRKDADAAAATVDDIEALGARGRAFPASVDDPDAATALGETVLAEFGPVDILVCNAGIASRGGTVAETSLDEVDRLMRTHAYSAFQLCRVLLPVMREQPRADLVFISSVAARLMGARSAPYTMAKVALEALALTLAKEERTFGIHANVVAPGLVDTEMGRRLVRGAMGIADISALDATSPFGRVCRPEDIADVVRYLVSPAAGYVNGQVLSVDGGG